MLYLLVSSLIAKRSKLGFYEITFSFGRFFYEITKCFWLIFYEITKCFVRNFYEIRKCWSIERALLCELAWLK